MSESYPHVLGKCTIKGFQYFYKASQVILIWNNLTCLNRLFHKKMSVVDMEKYFHNEKFEFLVVKTFDMGCYGFNLKCADQHATAKKIIQDVNSFIVNGWKVARHIPKMDS